MSSVQNAVATNILKDGIDPCYKKMVHKTMTDRMARIIASISSEDSQVFIKYNSQSGHTINFSKINLLKNIYKYIFITNFDPEQITKAIIISFYNAC